MLLARFEPPIPASDQPQTLALDSSATGIASGFEPATFQVVGSASTTCAIGYQSCSLVHSGVGRDSSIGIATSYGLDDLRIQSRLQRDFPHPSTRILRPTQPPVQWVQGVLPGSKVAGAWRWPPTSSRAEVDERIELYLCSSCGLSWQIIAWILPLPTEILILILVYQSFLFWE